MSRLLYLNVGENAAQFYSSSAGADPQIQFFQNFNLRQGQMADYSLATMSIYAVNIPLSISFNNVAVAAQFKNTTGVGINDAESVAFGLYSMNNSTLSLANSAAWITTHAVVETINSGTSWLSMATSATQNITPGAWYFGLFYNFDQYAAITSIFQNSSVNPGNAQPALVMGRMTVSTAAMPASIATSDLDITGSDATRQPYIIITA